MLNDIRKKRMQIIDLLKIMFTLQYETNALLAHFENFNHNYLCGWHCGFETLALHSFSRTLEKPKRVMS